MGFAAFGSCSHSSLYQYKLSQKLAKTWSHLDTPNITHCILLGTLKPEPSTLPESRGGVSCACASHCQKSGIRKCWVILGPEQ